MSKHFATSIKYGGQRVSVNRDVTVKYDGDLCAGKVVSISADGERPIIRMFSDQSPDGEHDSAFGFDTSFGVPFHDIKTEADIETAPDRCWFWPPRV